MLRRGMNCKSTLGWENIGFVLVGNFLLNLSWYTEKIMIYCGR